MSNQDYITQYIKGEIRLVVVAFYKADATINQFLQNFRSSLVSKKSIVLEKKFDMIRDSIAFFRELPKNHLYNCVMLITHGKKDGTPTFEETSTDPGSLDELVENWNFLSLVLNDAATDRLVLLAVCYSGSKVISEDITGGESFALYVVTPAEGKPMEVTEGAKAMALFIDTLVGMNKAEYGWEHLKQAKKVVDKRFKDVIELWDF